MPAPSSASTYTSVHMHTQRHRDPAASQNKMRGLEIDRRGVGRWKVRGNARIAYGSPNGISKTNSFPSTPNFDKQPLLTILPLRSRCTTPASTVSRTRSRMSRLEVGRTSLIRELRLPLQFEGACGQFGWTLRDSCPEKVERGSGGRQRGWGKYRRRRVPQ